MRSAAQQESVRKAAAVSGENRRRRAEDRKRREQERREWTDSFGMFGLRIEPNANGYIVEQRILPSVAEIVVETS